MVRNTTKTTQAKGVPLQMEKETVKRREIIRITTNPPKQHPSPVGSFRSGTEISIVWTFKAIINNKASQYTNTDEQLITGD